MENESLIKAILIRWYDDIQENRIQSKFSPRTAKNFLEDNFGIVVNKNDVEKLLLKITKEYNKMESSYVIEQRYPYSIISDWKQSQQGEIESEIQPVEEEPEVQQLIEEMGEMKMEDKDVKPEQEKEEQEVDITREEFEDIIMKVWKKAIKIDGHRPEDMTWKFVKSNYLQDYPYILDNSKKYLEYYKEWDENSPPEVEQQIHKWEDEYKQSQQEGWSKKMVRNDEGKLRITSEPSQSVSEKKEEVPETSDFQEILDDLNDDSSSSEDAMQDTTEIEQEFGEMSVDKGKEEKKMKKKIGVGLRMKNLFKEVEKEIKRRKEEKLQLMHEYEIDSQDVPLEISMTLKIKQFLPYYAILTYYLSDKSIPVTDPFLTSFFSNFYNIDDIFIQSFKGLNPADRIDMISKYFDGQPLNIIYDSLSIKQLAQTIPAQTFINKYSTEKQTNQCQNIQNAVENEMLYNTMFYILSIGDIDDSEFTNIESLETRMFNDFTVLLKQRINCVSNLDESTNTIIKNFISNLTNNLRTKSDLLDKVQSEQLERIVSLFKTKFGVYSEDIDSIQQLIQDMYTEEYPEIINNIRDVYKGEIPTSKQLLFNYVPDEARSELNMMSTNFDNQIFRDKITNIVDSIKNSFTNELEQVKQIKKMLKNKEIDELDAQFLLTFIKFYGSLQHFPTERHNSMLSLNNIENYPQYIQTVIQTKLRNIASIAEQEIKKSTIIKSEQQSLLMQLQVELNKDKQYVDGDKVVDIINKLDLNSEVKSRFLRLVREGEFKNVYVLLKSADVGTKTLLNPLVYTGRKRSERLQKLQESQSYSEQIVSRLPNVSGPLRECILQQFLAPWKTIEYEKSDNREFHWIKKDKRPYILQRERGFSYFIADPYLSKEELSDEQKLFFGARIPIPEFSISISKGYGHTWSKDPERLGEFKETIETTEPVKSNIPLSDRVYSIALVYVYEHPLMTKEDILKYDSHVKRLLKNEYRERPSYNALQSVMERFKNRRPDQDVYQHAKEITQTMVKTVRITDNREVLPPIYTPTTYFWKIYCSGHATYEKGLIVLRYSKDGEEHEQSFSMGILYKNPHYKSPYSEEWITEVITQQDFKNEQEWMKEKASIKTTFYKFCRTVLSEIKIIRESARTRGLETINKVLTQFYKNTNTKELVIGFQSRRLEDAIYNHENAITLYDYFKIIQTILFFLNPENPIYNSLHYFRYLFLNTNPGSYYSILFDHFEEYAPELYLLNKRDKDEITSAFGFFIESSTLNDCKFLYNITDVSRSKSHIESSFYTSSLLNVLKERTQKIFQHTDASLLKNICVNHEMVSGQPSVVIESDKQLYCFDNNQVEQILENIFPYEIPEDVKNQLRRHYTVDSLKHSERLSVIKEEANIYVGRYLSQLIEDWNISFVDKNGKFMYKKPFKQVSEMPEKAVIHLDNVINNIELFEMKTLITDTEKELILQHMLDQINVEYFSRIDNLVFKYLDKHHSIGNEMTHLNEQEEIHKDNPNKINDIINQKQNLLQSLFEYINSDLHITLPDTIEKYILNFVSSKFKPASIQNESKIYKCHTCAKDVETPLWKTYYTEVSTTFCSRSCLTKVDDSAMMEDRSEAIQEQLVKSLLWPYLQPRLVVDKIPQVNPNDIMSVAKSYGIESVPHVYSRTAYILSGEGKGSEDKVIELKDDPQVYDNLYGNILRLPNFVLPDNILQERQSILMQLAKIFEIDTESDKMEDDINLAKIFKALRKNKKFEKVYQIIANSYISERINTHLERLIIDLIEKDSSSALAELTVMFGINKNYNKDQIVEELQKIDEVKSIVRRYQTSNKLIEYGYQLSRTSEGDDKTPFGVLIANEFRNKLDRFNFKHDLFEPFMKIARINYAEIRQFLKNYELIKRDTMIIDSLGQAFRDVRSNTPDMNVVFDLMNMNYKIRLEKERESNPLVARKFSEWNINVINADMINNIGQHIGFGTLQDFGEASVEFVHSSFDSFSDFIFRKHHFITRQIQHVNDVLSDLREIRDAFIKQIIKLHYQKDIDEFTIVQPQSQRKTPQVNLPPSKRTIKSSNKIVSSKTKMVSRKEIKKQAPVQSDNILMNERQDTNKEMKLLSEDLIQKSERVLREMFSPLYVSPFKQTVKEGMKVKIVDAPETFRKYINKEGMIYTVRTKTNDKYIVRVDGILVPLTRKQFEILESGEFIEEDIQQPSEDAIVDEEIAEEIIGEFGDEKDVIEKDAEQFIDVNEEEQEEPEDVEYGEEIEDEYDE